MVRIEEWKNRGEIKDLWRYVVTSLVVALSLPVAFMTILAFVTVTLGLTFEEPGVEVVIADSSLLMRFIHLVNFGLMILFYYFVVQFTRGVVFVYKQWVVFSISLIPFFYYLFTGV